MDRAVIPVLSSVMTTSSAVVLVILNIPMMVPTDAETTVFGRVCRLIWAPGDDADTTPTAQLWLNAAGLPPSPPGLKRRDGDRAAAAADTRVRVDSPVGTLPVRGSPGKTGGGRIHAGLMCPMMENREHLRQRLESGRGQLVSSRTTGGFAQARNFSSTRRHLFA